jgi:hypothetical protein
MAGTATSSPVGFVMHGHDALSLPSILRPMESMASKRGRAGPAVCGRWLLARAPAATGDERDAVVLQIAADDLPHVAVREGETEHADDPAVRDDGDGLGRLLSG